MNHERVVERLSEYRDGALGAAECEEISRHLSDCADCSAVLSEWAALSQAFFRRPAPPTAFQTESFVSRVSARLPGAAPSPLAWLTGRGLVPALGLGFAALLFSFRPYAPAEISDPSAVLLVGADRAAVSPPPAADVSGFGAEGR